MPNISHVTLRQQKERSNKFELHFVTWILPSFPGTSLRRKTLETKHLALCWTIHLLGNHYGWFSPDVNAAMLVHRTKEKKVFWEFDSVIVQNMSHNLLLFCAPTWPCYHVIENHLLLSPWSHPLNLRWRRQQPTPQKTTRNKVRHNCAEWYRGVDKTWGRP